LNNNIPIVSGTTGWLEHYNEMAAMCIEKDGAFIYGSNFSLGVNLFFDLNAKLAKMMNRFNQYKVSMEEIHHTQKLDKPSGTAISLANEIISEFNLSKWSIENPEKNELFIDVKRIDSVPGTHSVFYSSDVDTIEIKHTAHNRDGFAFGAIIAAEWLHNKKGIFSMKDVLEL
jgi:4-hydroxy-tetrahydrodipicolinate reductase